MFIYYKYTGCGDEIVPNFFYKKNNTKCTILNQAGLDAIGMSISMSHKFIPDKIVHQLKIGAC